MISDIFQSVIFPTRINTDIGKLKKKFVPKKPKYCRKEARAQRTLYLSNLQELIKEYTKDLEPEDYLFLT